MRNRVERLKIVFALGEPIKTESGSVGKVTLKLETLKQPIAAIDALTTIISIMKAFEIAPQFRLNGAIIPPQTLLTQVERKGKFSELVADGLSFEFGIVASRRHCYVKIVEETPNAAFDWDAWVKPFSEMPGFVQAWIADDEYEHWQNVTDPMRFKSAGREYAHFKLVSNGLPPPVNRMIIDLSNNPGRWMLRDGYIEAVGAKMWLSKLFWENVGHDNSALVESADWLQSDMQDNGILRVQAQPNCFQDDSTADLQNRIRTLLYAHTNAH